MASSYPNMILKCEGFDFQALLFYCCPLGNYYLCASEIN